MIANTKYNFRFMYITPKKQFWAVSLVGKKRRISRDLFNELLGVVPTIGYKASLGLKLTKNSAVIVRPVFYLVTLNHFRSNNEDKRLATHLNALNNLINVTCTVIKSPVLIFECVQFVKNYHTFDYFNVDQDKTLYKTCLSMVLRHGSSLKLAPNLRKLIGMQPKSYDFDTYNSQVKSVVFASYTNFQKKASEIREPIVLLNKLSRRVKHKLHTYYFTPYYKQKITEYNSVKFLSLVEKLSFEKTLEYYELRSRLDRNKIPFYCLLEYFDPPFFVEITKPDSIHVKQIEIFNGRLFPMCPVTGLKAKYPSIIKDVCSALDSIEKDSSLFEDEWYHIKECLERFFSLSTEVWYWAYFKLVSTLKKSVATTILHLDSKLKLRYYTSIESIAWNPYKNNWQLLLKKKRTCK